jgi:diguanylate cyclase (GGDEF)-like protein
VRFACYAKRSFRILFAVWKIGRERRLPRECGKPKLDGGSVCRRNFAENLEVAPDGKSTVIQLETMRNLRISISEGGWHPRGNEVELETMTKISQNDSPQAPAQALSKPAELIRENLQHLDRRQWWLGSTTVAVVLLLTLCVASFAFPEILKNEESNYSFFLNQAVRALVGLVLVFSVYLIYQQVQISKLRTQLGAQIDSLAKVESLASEVYKLAALDQLTGLYNRRSGEQRLAEEISRAQRHGRPLTVLLMDLDGLKSVNDKHGHAAGDTVIKHFADRLQRAIRGSDLAVRLGGDEFMAILPECRSGEVKHVLGRIEGLDFEFDEQKVRLRFSSGWTDYLPMETMQEFLKRADVALYEDKRDAKRGSGVVVPQPVAVPQSAS